MSKYKRLEIIFSDFNEAIITFYKELSILVPGEHRLIMHGLRNTLDNSNLVFKQAADLIFTNIKN